VRSRGDGRRNVRKRNPTDWSAQRPDLRAHVENPKERMEQQRHYIKANDALRNCEGRPNQRQGGLAASKPGSRRDGGQPIPTAGPNANNSGRRKRVNLIEANESVISGATKMKGQSHGIPQMEGSKSSRRAATMVRGWRRPRSPKL
jgi:hypothetical protein